MMKQIKLVFFAAAMVAVVTSAQATNYNSDLIIGFTDGMHNDVVYDLGAKSAITNGQTWNLGSTGSNLLSSFTLSTVNWGVVGDKLNIGTAWSTTDGTFVPGTIGNLQVLSPIDNATVTIYGNMPAAGAGQHFSIPYTDDTSWNVETINADHDSDYVSEYINPNSIGLVTNNFYSIKDDGSDPVLSGHFILAANGVVTFNTNSVSSPSAPVAGFSGSPTNIFVTQFVVFTNTSTGSIASWAWNFGNGTLSTGFGTNVTVIYNSPGIYSVQLIVTGSGGSSTNTQTAYIVVKPRPFIGNPVLSGGNFIFSGTNGVAGAQYRILSSTNVSLALTNWTPVATNAFAANGSYNYTNSSTTNMANFFRLVSP
jgi:PKD repeat protein